MAHTSPPDPLQQAIDWQTSGDLQRAEQAYRALMGQPACPPQVYTNLAIICQATDRLEEAITLWGSAVDRQPAAAQQHLYLAMALKAVGQLEPAVASFRKVLALDGSSLAARYNLGNTLQQLNRHREAIECYEQALVLNPQLAQAYYNLGNSWRVLGEQDRARSAYQQSVALQPDLDLAHNNLGNVLRDQGDLVGAITAYRRALALNPDSPDPHYNLGNALFETAEFAAAIPYFDRAGIRDSQARSLYCCYRTEQFEAFHQRLARLRQKPHTSPLVAALAGHYATNFAAVSDYNFCPEPLEFVYHRAIDALRGTQAPLRDALLQLVTAAGISERKQGRLYRGKQSSGNLFSRDDPPLQQLAAEITRHLLGYREQFGGASCELIQRFPQHLEFESAWYISMRSGGYLSGHIHETGWLSGVVYLQLPRDDSSPDAGGLELSMHGDDLPRRVATFPSRMVPLAVGDIVLFPASLFHRTIAFHSNEQRISVAFDLKPAAG